MRAKGEQSGSVRKKNGNYTVRFYQWRMKDGKMQYLQTEKVVGRIADYASRKAAELDAYARFVLPANTQKAAAHGTFTVEEFWKQRFRTDIVEHHSKSWKAAVESIMSTHILPRFGALQLSEVRRMDVQDFLQEKNATHSAQTVRHIQKTLYQMFRHATRLEVFNGSNPAEDLILPKLVWKERQALTMDQVRQLVSVLPDQYGRVALLLTLTGMRIGECLGLRWRAVDLQARTLSVVEQFTAGEQKSETKTRAGIRMVPLTATAVSILQQELAASKWTGEDHYVFAARNGRPLNAQNILKRFLAPAAEKLGLGHVVWHTFRHTTATMIDRYATSAQKQALLGHTSEAMSNRYTHSTIEDMRKSLEAATGTVQ